MIVRVVRKLSWWLQRRRKEAELREELEFHLAEEAAQQEARGLSSHQARTAATRDLGNVALLREDARSLWTWTLVEQLAQDVRYAFRTMGKAPGFTVLVALSLAFGIGANTAIYSFMDALLFRSLPVREPGSLVAFHWRSKPYAVGSRAMNGSEFVLHSIDGRTYPDASGTTGAIFPFAAFERLQQVSAPVLSSLFGYFAAGDVNVVVNGAAEVSRGQYVSGEFFSGLGVYPAAGRLLVPDDDRAGAPAVAVISTGYAERRFGSAAAAIGQSILINNANFTVAGVTPAQFAGIDPGEAPQVFVPLHANLLIEPADGQRYVDQNYYWLGMMARLRPGVTVEQAEAALTGPFAQWVQSTATNDRELANLPILRLEEGARGLDGLRRQYSKPLYVLLAMVVLILAIACANTANLLLARATVRRREMAVRLSIGASRFRVMRQLLTESVLLASLGGALGIFIAVAGMRVLNELLASGRDGFVFRAELNWHVLAATVGLSILCGMVFGVAPAIESVRPALMPTLREVGGADRRTSFRGAIPRLGVSRALVVAQVAISLLLLVAAGLFVRTLSNLHAVHLGFDREHVLLFDVNAPKAGRPPSQIVDYYADLRRRLADIPGVRNVTLSHASLIQAGRAHPVTVDGVPAQGTRILYTGPEFFTTMRIPIVRGRQIEERDRPGALQVAVVSEDFARRYLADSDPIGRRVKIAGSLAMELEIVGVAGTARYGRLKAEIPPVLYIAYAQVPPARQGQMTYALRVDGEPLRYASLVSAHVREADARVPVTNLRTQVADIDSTINQEIIFARLCTMFAILALVIAGVGLYGMMSYTVARRTRELGIRIALGARPGVVIWMVLREVCLLAALGLMISVPIALASTRVVASFLFNVKPNDPQGLALSAIILFALAMLAGYGPSRRASRVDATIALRQE